VSGSTRLLAHHRAWLLALAASAGVIGCKEASDPPKVASIVGMADVDSVRLGKTYSFGFVELRDAAGNKLTGRKATWTSLDPNVVSIDANGVATGKALGATVITARADGATASTNLRVQPLVASVVVFPPTASVALGSSRALNVTVSDGSGLALAGRTVSFSSSNPAIATVNASGLVVGVSIGRAIITATAVQDGVSGTSTIDVVQAPVASITITPPGSQTVFQGLTLQLAATLRDGNQPSNILTGRAVSWTTSNPAVATVSSSGLVTGNALGSAQITVESEGVTASVQVTVQPRPVATVALSPNPGSVKAGTQLQMTLDLRDVNGNALTTAGRTVTWESSNKPVATVQDGVVNGVTPGSVTITVTVDGKSASALVSVTP
jgi:uncharacterized protein YjdB